MGEQRLMLFLLPGMDGTGELFAAFVKLLPAWIEPRVVSYPRDQTLSYDQLLPILRSATPGDKPFVILAESFSTPLAVKFASEYPNGLIGMVLCAGFVLPPRRNVLRGAALALSPVLFSFGLPDSVCRHFLVGDTAPQCLVDEIQAIVSKVSRGILASRLRSVLSCNGERELRTVSVPLLYLCGRQDRLVGRSSFREIQQAKPDAQLASIDAPHLILQAKPDEAVDFVLPFLLRVQDGLGT